MERSNRKSGAASGFQDGDLVERDGLISSHEHESLDAGLGDEDAIEGILVNLW